MSDHREARTRVGLNVRRLRRAHGLSQERLAEMSGRNTKHIGQIERGEVNVGLDVLDSVASALGVDVADLFALSPRRRVNRSLFIVDEAALKRVEAVFRAVRRAPLFPAKDDAS